MNESQHPSASATLVARKDALDAQVRAKFSVYRRGVPHGELELASLTRDSFSMGHLTPIASSTINFVLNDDLMRKI